MIDYAKKFPTPVDEEGIKKPRLVTPIGTAQWCKLFTSEIPYEIKNGKKPPGSAPNEFSTNLVLEPGPETDAFLDCLKRFKDAYNPAHPEPWEMKEGKAVVSFKCKAERNLKGGRKAPWRPPIFQMVNGNPVALAGEDPETFKDPGYGIGNESKIQVKFRCWPHDFQKGGIALVLMAVVVHELDRWVPENPLDGFGFDVDAVTEVPAGGEGTPF